MKTFLDDKNIDYQQVNDRIIQERNWEIKSLESDIQDIAEIMFDLSLMVNDQGETLETAIQNIENTEMATYEAVKNLEKTEFYLNKSRKILRSAGIIIGGATVGAIGFIVGPIIGADTLVSGGVLGSEIAYLTNKII